MSLPINKLINSRYIVTKLIGSGGMSEIYVANDIYYQRTVAIKILKPEQLNKTNIARFKNEIRFASAVNNAHVEKIFNVGEYEGSPFMTYELFRGKTVKETLDSRGKFLPLEAIDNMLQVLDGIKSIHDHEILHNDIKPDNMMLMHDGTIKIVDFGIATHINDSAFTHLLASAQYVAPEVIINKSFSIQSDIYSLGITFFEFLTGKTPFMKSNTKEELAAHLNENVPSLKNYIQHNLVNELDYVINKATNRNLLKRYKNCGEFINDLIKLKNKEPLHNKGFFAKLFQK